MANVLIDCRNITKKIGEHTIIDDVTLSIQAGEIYGIVGPRGSGKTALFKMIAGLYHPTSGVVTLCGFNIAEAPTKAKQFIGYIPTISTAYDRLTGREVLEFVGELHSMLRKERDKKIQSLLHIYHLENRADEYFENYSHVVRQKFFIIAAFLHNPAILLVDDSIADFSLEDKEITYLLFTTFAQNGGAILFTASTVEIAERICTTFGIFSKGKLIKESPHQSIVLHHKKRELFVESPCSQARKKRYSFPFIFRWGHGFLFEKDFLIFIRSDQEIVQAGFFASLLFFCLFILRGV